MTVSHVLPLVSLVPTLLKGGTFLLPPLPTAACNQDQWKQTTSSTQEYLRGCRNGLKISFCFLCRQAHSHLIWATPQLRSERGKITSGLPATMCYGKCARCIGQSLVGLAILCIVANILLYFPNGETKYASEEHLSKFVWFFSGIIGGGLLVSCSKLLQP